MTPTDNIASQIIEDAVSVIQSIDLEEIRIASMLMIRHLQCGKRIFTCGNGGSAAHASHLAAELLGRFNNKTRRSLSATCLNSDDATMTAIANDFGYHRVFSRQLEGLGNTGDLLVAFSTSGQSPNVTDAIRSARLLNINTIYVTRRLDRMHQTEDIVIIGADSTVTARIQEAHQVIIHILCEILDEAFA